MYRVVLKRQARKQLQALAQKERVKIQRAIDYLSHDPFAGKKLHGEYAGTYALRVWPYRIIYRVEKKRITVYVLAR